MKKTPILYREKLECTGCSACASLCPKHAIIMQEDSEGFLYPVIKSEICINCQQCIRVCPMNVFYKGQKEKEPIKAGIITLYYQNYNYGGIAQAYALYKALQKIGICSEMLSYRRENQSFTHVKGSLLDKIKRNTLAGLWRRYFGKCKRQIEKQIGKKYQESLKKRTKMMDAFIEQIPHTDVLTKEQIPEYVQKYSIVISGGDQIWRPGIADEAFLFSGIKCSDSQKVISYASSAGVEVFQENYLTFMKEELKKYAAIAVRERITADTFSKLFGYKIEHVVDPTFLLKREDWEKVTAKRLIKVPYIFCYFIGNNKAHRKTAKDIVRKEGKYLVTLPYIQGGNRFSFRLEDWHFGEEQMFEVGMGEFFSLIKYADCVLTDSFHATVFSILFQREFWVFEKEDSHQIHKTTSRIYELTSMVGLEKRIWKKENIGGEKAIDYSEVEKKLKFYIEKSWDYLYRNLKNED